MADTHLLAVRPVGAPTDLVTAGLLAGIVDAADDAIVGTNPAGTIIVWNRAAERLYGYEAHEAIGAPASLIVPPEGTDEADAVLAQAAGGRRVTGVETVRLTRAGLRIRVSVSAVPVVDAAGQVVAVSCTGRDLTATTRRARRRRPLRPGHRDALTGLPDRSELERLLRRAVAGVPTADAGIVVVVVGVDHFKAVNDSAGHRAGDRLVRSVAHRLRTTVPASDTVARFGTDEFALVRATASGADEVDALASTILDAFARPVRLAHRDFWATLSIGVTVGGAANSAGELLRQAAAAMRRAREARHVSVVRYESESFRGVESHLERAQALRHALDSDQFVLHYQPIVDLATERVVGAEALVRWQHPDRGLLGPGEFVPLAEQLGLIERLGDWVLRQAGRQAARWDAVRPGFTTAINVSVEQLESDHLLLAAEALAAEGTDLRCLVLEITETSFMNESIRSAATLDGLRHAGIGIAIDDFGTGYASLAYLKRLPATAIKIDRSFTAGLPQPRDLSVVMAILAIADAYGLETVAEGIETAAQAAILLELGCARGQGFHFARPAGPEAVTALLRRSAAPS
jgi:diguanylate cyclase (GGDEF)-like protein/PAS domain S-box-containing protein